jgi:hypothetical protein
MLARARTTIALAATIAIWASPARAQEGPVVVPSEPIPVDSLEFVIPDTIPFLAPRFIGGEGELQLAAIPTEDPLPRNPRNAAIRAFLIPGWGQVYTGHRWKAALFAGAEVYFFLRAYSKQKDALDLQDDLQAAREAFFADPPEGFPEDPLAQETAFDTTEEAREIRAELESVEESREDFYAWTFLSVFFAAVDAYVSAQLDPLRLLPEPEEHRVWVSWRVPLGGGGPARESRGNP